MPVDRRLAPPPLSRRRALRVGIGAVAGLGALGVLGVELVERGVLPGASLLDEIDGACDVTDPTFDVRAGSASESGRFFSRYRHRSVGYTVGLPPGFERGDELALVVMLHGEGENHRHALPGLSPGQAVSLTVGGQPLAPMAMVTVDGGRGYWHPHPDDDPMGMVVHELVPMLQRRGLGRAPGAIGTLGISMGGYGALLFAECYPHVFSAVAAISPAIWTSYAQARSVNSAAYDSPSQFARYDAVTHAPALADTPVRIASGLSDPFHPGVAALAARLGANAEVLFPGGCHTEPFFRAELPASLTFLGEHLVRKLS